MDAATAMYIKDIGFLGEKERARGDRSHRKVFDDSVIPFGHDDLGQIPVECFGVDPEAPEHDVIPNFREYDFIPIEDFTEEDLDRENDFILDRKSLRSCIAAGERLAEILHLWLDESGVPAVIAAYLEDQMDGIVREFCRGTETVRKASCVFVEKLHEVLSRQEGHECWPSPSERSREKLAKWMRGNGHAPVAGHFAELVFGPSVATRILAA